MKCPNEMLLKTYFLSLQATAGVPCGAVSEGCVVDAARLVLEAGGLQVGLREFLTGLGIPRFLASQAFVGA